MIGIVDINMGNLRSVANAVYNLGFDPSLTKPGESLDEFSHLVLPGVGAFHTASERLREHGLNGAIRSFAASGRPVLGICLGMQLLADQGEEGALTSGLGLIPGRVIRLEPGEGRRIPHVGWNNVTLRKQHPVFTDVKPGRDFYFVHSFHFAPEDSDHICGVTEYGVNFCSVVARKNVLGLQFHPEKSQLNGMRLLEGFCRWSGEC